GSKLPTQEAGKTSRTTEYQTGDCPGTEASETTSIKNNRRHVNGVGCHAHGLAWAWLTVDHATKKSDRASTPGA
ncbi:MAG TPA: hypothetical protein VG055_11270, partial [Planctomycetaceae bacterium]|nr:hypothetical protein [Planctomycetaceae bacterium]